jgi:hypothetical protein
MANVCAEDWLAPCLFRIEDSRIRIALLNAAFVRNAGEHLCRRVFLIHSANNQIINQFECETPSKRTVERPENLGTTIALEGDRAFSAFLSL